MKLTDTQEYIKDNFLDLPQNWILFNDVYEFKNNHIDEYILNVQDGLVDSFSGGFEVLEIFDLVSALNFKKFQDEVELAVLNKFKEYVKYELYLIEDYESLEEDESDLDRELHDREEAKSINKDLK